MAHEIEQAEVERFLAQEEFLGDDKEVEHDCPIDEARPGWNVGHVRHPQFVGPAATKRRLTRSGAGR